jgi:catechol 2,3-dioxygenase-like lactoylglutathione lyase family enzyme
VGDERLNGGQGDGASMPSRQGTAQPLYTGLRVRSLPRSVRFYVALGFRLTLRSRTTIGEFAQLEHPTGGFTLELNRFRKGSRAWEPYRKGSELDHLGFWVNDVDAWVRRLRRRGGKVRYPAFDGLIVIPPRPAFAGRAAYVADPDGIWVELMGPRRKRTQVSRKTAGRR